MEKLKGAVRWLGLPALASCAILLAAAIVIWAVPATRSTFESVARVVELAILTIGLTSLVLLARQTRTTAKWSKLLSYHQFFGDLITKEMVVALQETAKLCTFEECMKKLEPMSSAAVDAVLADPAHDTVVSSYLDEFEEFCAAVHAGIADPEYAYTLEATRVIRAWIVFEPFIRRCRASTKYSRCYLELQRLGSAWKTRREAEESKKDAADGVRNHVD